MTNPDEPPPVALASDPIANKRVGRIARLAPVCMLQCGVTPIHVFNVDGVSYLLANDVMRATGNHTARASVEHAVSTFPELRLEGASILRPVKGVNGKTNRLLTVEAAVALVARSRSRHAIDVQRWLLGTFGGSGWDTASPAATGMEPAAPMALASDLVRLELTVTVAKARRILAIAAK